MLLLSCTDIFGPLFVILSVYFAFVLSVNITQEYTAAVCILFRNNFKKTSQWTLSFEIYEVYLFDFVITTKMKLIGLRCFRLKIEFEPTLQWRDL